MSQYLNDRLSAKNLVKNIGLLGAFCIGISATIPGISVAEGLNKTEGFVAQTNSQPTEPMQSEPMQSEPMQGDMMQENTPEMQTPPEQVPGGPAPTSPRSPATLSLAAPPPGTWLCLNNPNPACGQ